MHARRAITTWVIAVTAVLGLSAPAQARLRTPSVASAAAAWGSCPEADGARCTTVRVPLDRSGALAGKIDLHVARVAVA
ncbi:MAG: hypothetical protein H0U06_10575, partial [Solirubrobacterales bacterium]|nr:hypothetical protein [Solirubrobacterales bacterium]